MITSDFYTILEKHPLIGTRLQGVYGSNTLRQVKLHKFCIVNTMPIKFTGELSGEHWYVLYKDSSSTIECFDSLGVNAEKKETLRRRFETSRIKEIDFNTSAVQRSDTITCGHFSLYFIFQRLLNQDLPFDLLLNEIFCHNLDENEKRVNNFFHTVILESES